MKRNYSADIFALSALFALYSIKNAKSAESAIAENLFKVIQNN